MDLIKAALMLGKFVTKDRLKSAHDFIDKHGDDIANIAKGIGAASAFMQKKSEERRQRSSIARLIEENLKAGNFSTVDIGLTNKGIIDDDFDVRSK